jgi:hypothetical protein
MPGKPFQSKLEPYFDLILEARRNRQTWVAIVQLLADHEITITRPAIYAFLKRRMKRRYSFGMAPAQSRPMADSPPDIQEPDADLPKLTSSESESALSRLTSPVPVKGPLWKQT